ncbi:MAG: hypothetical protein FLDDKLPJ_03171 [Phycisphaerae bacterium]|nr:hypothetical protein [Phycisphaerae bacterium]
MARKTESTAEPHAPEAPPTQRAYTLRLRGADTQDDSWRDALWATHESVNKGAKVFGEWLLTLRGGLSHELAEPPPPPKGKKRNDDDTAVLRKNRRILLALSWLSVEDALGAPNGAVRIAGGQDADSVRRDKVLTALRSVLAGCKLGNRAIESWVEDCADSLSARIRDDAVWVNRSAVFDAKAAEFRGLTREYATETVLSFFGPADDYFSLPDADADDGATLAAGDDDSKFKQKARQWISTNFGTGEKSDTGQIITSLRKLAKADLNRFARRPKAELIEAMSKKVNGPTSDLDGLRIGIGWSTGRPSKGRLAVENLPDRPTKSDIESMQKKFAEEADDKDAKSGARDVPRWMPSFRGFVEAAIGMPFVGPRNHIGEFSVMLDHAARRVSIGHSWIKRAEAERRRFEADAQRLGTVPADAAAWLDAFVQERSGSAGGEYRIRRRAVEGWDEILMRWKRPTCASAEDRVAAAREVQADPEIDKFGDIQLFEALASDDALCVWRNGNDVAPGQLKDYVFAHDARFKQRRFKVPAYRHPDALRHPVFSDFGNSRWKVEYSALKAAKAARGGRRIGTQDTDWLGNPRLVRLGLWNGDAVNDFDLRWSCKRLSADLALTQPAHNGQVRSVSRADRLGRAASGIKPGESPSPAALFSQAEWNARLQAPRSQLNDLAAYLDRNGGRWDDKAKRIRDRLAWLVTFSAKLECRGPFISFAVARTLTDPAREVQVKPRNSEDEWRGLAFPFWHPDNKGRKAHAKHLLSRLLGLRVLSVDLGHRFAAACAVWETLSRAALKKEIAGRAVTEGGTGGSDLYLHTRHTDRAGKERTTIYRRVGSDKLPDGSEHPAPWARLDRQFLIKLQGEEAPARKASQEEIKAVRGMETELGRLRDERNPLPMRVDELMGEAVRTVRLALRRLGDSARIAYAFKPDAARLMPGGGAAEHTPETRKVAMLDALMRWHDLATGDRWTDPTAKATWTQHIVPMLSAELPTLSEEADRWERKRHRAALEVALDSVAVALVSDGAARLHTLWSDRWKTDNSAWRPRLKWLRHWVLPRGLRPVSGESAQHAAKRKARRDTARHVGGLSLTRIATIRELYQVQKAYAMRAEPDDLRKNIAAKDDDRFAEFGRSVLEVVERLREQRVKQLASRIAASALGLGGHWKEVERRDHKGKPLLGKDGKPRTKSVWVEEPSPKYSTCHAVVIENLRNYRPDELQTRRENRALMNWSAGKVRKYVEEACQLHGLHLREVMPNYTSRQCSRTGLPGIRCVDLAIDSKTGEPKAYWWKKALSAAKKKIGNGDEKGKKGDAESRFIVDLADHLAKLKKDGKPLPKTVRVPRNGGDLFIAAPPDGAETSDRAATVRERSASALQADLNAAANIGLRGLLDPDFPGRWWYIPASMDNEGWRIPASKSCAGAVCLNGWKVAHKDGCFSPDGAPLAVADHDESVKRAQETVAEAKKELDAAKKAAKKPGADRAALDVAKKRHEEAKAALKEAEKAASQKEIVNMWQDPRAERPRHAAGPWWETGAYWNDVKARVVSRLRAANGLDGQEGTDPIAEQDLPW